MNKIFLILGYGIPKDIFEDLEYRSYLAAAFNNIFKYAREHKEGKIRIIFSGGKTDMIAPYKRSEAGEMKNFFDFLAKREFVRDLTKDWTLLTDTASLSTMENILNSKKIIEKRNIKSARIGIFCEFTRKSRITKLAKTIFGSGYKVEVFAIDFSISQNRYLDIAYIIEKEKNALKFDLWALESEENLKVYHKKFSDKFKFLRSYGPEKHQEAIQVWWKNECDLALQKGFIKKKK